jgi:flagellar basal-body rod protein FlgF
MNYGTYLSTGSVLASMRRMDVIANNLANANTIGFKSDLVTAAERPAERVEGLSPFADPLALPQPILEKLGGGIKFLPDRIDFTQGTLERTDNATDLALQGEGFFVVAPANGKKPDPKAPIELTRAGSLHIDVDGTMRMAGTNRALLGESGEPVRIDPKRPFAVDKAGRIFQNDTEVARFRVVKAKNAAAVEKAGANIFRVSSGAAGVERTVEGTTEVHQRMLEQSAADPVTSMVELMRQSRMLEANVRMIQYQDNLSGQAISGITRII